MKLSMGKKFAAADFPAWQKRNDSLGSMICVTGFIDAAVTYS